MAESITRVIYEALADFSSLHVAADQAVADLDRIKSKEAEVNAASALGSDKATASQEKQTKTWRDQLNEILGVSKAAKDLSNTTKDLSSSEKDLGAETDGTTKKTKAAKVAFEDLTKTKTEAQKATKALSTDVSDLGKSMLDGVKNLFSHKNALDENTKSTTGFRSALRSTLNDLKEADLVTRTATNGFDRLNSAMVKFLKAGTGRGGIPPVALLIPLITGILALINPVVAGISSIGGALFGLMSNLGSLVGVLTVIPGSIGAFITSLGVLKFAFSGVGTALQAYQTLQQTAVTDTKAHTAAQQAYNDALSKLSPAAQTFTKWLVSMTGAWSNFKSSISQNFFSQFNSQLGSIAPLFQVITTVMDKAASAVGGVVSQFLKLAQTSSFHSGLSLFGDQNAKLISTIGGGLISILDTIGKLTVAAGPFTQRVAEGLSKAADSLDKIVTTASGNGSLAAWLGRVYTNLQLWWGIVSDIAKTIFNYGSAAQSFGTWITKGLKDVTDGWLAASQAALKPGSNFQTWLTNIKPLVTELASIIGNFLSWWNQTSTNSNNINKMLTMLKDINDHLGPALGHLLDTMAKTTIGPDLIQFISAIVQMIDSLMSHGGAQVIEGIIHFLTSLADFLASVMAVPGVASTLMTVATALGAISALTFVNKFVPLIDAIAWLLRLADAEGPLTRVFNAWSGYKAPTVLADAAKTAATDSGTVISTGATAAKVEDSAASAGVKDAIGGLGSEAATVASAGLMSKIGGTIGKMLKGGFGGAGGITGIVASILGQMVGGAIANSAPSGSAGTNQRVGGNVLAGASGGAGTGAFIGGAIGSVVPGVGTAVGGLVGGAAGGTIGGIQAFESGTPADKKKFADEAVAWGNQNLQVVKDIFSEIVKRFALGGQQIGDAFSGLGKKLGHGADQIGTWLGQLGQAFGHGADQWQQYFADFGKNLAHGGKQIGDVFLSFVHNAGVGWGQWEKYFADFGQNLGHGADQIGTWLGQLGAAFGHGADQIGTWLGQLGAAFGHGASQISTWMGQVGTALKHGADQWQTYFADFGQNLGHGADQIGTWLGQLGQAFGHGGDQINTWLGQVATDLNHGADQWKYAVAHVGDSLKHGASQIATWWGQVQGDLKHGAQQIGDFFGSKQISSSWNTGVKSGSGSGSGGGHLGSSRMPFQAPAGFGGSGASSKLSPLPAAYSEPDTSGVILKVARAVDSETKARDALIKKKKEEQDADKKAIANDNANLTWQEKVAKALKDHIAAEQALKDAVGTTAKAQDAALKTMDAALVTNGKHWEDGTLAASKNKLAVIDYSVASTDAATALRKTGGSYDAYKAKLQESRQKIEDTIVSLGGNKQAAIDVATQLVKIPTQRQFNLLNNIDAVKAKANQFYNEWNGKSFSSTYKIFQQTYTLPTATAPKGLFPNKPHYGGVIRRAFGGEVPGFGNTDSVGALLTPGEIVINKQVVEAVGSQNLLDLNSGLVTYSQMLNKAMSEQPHSKLKDTNPSFLTGSGLSSPGLSTPRGFSAPSIPSSNSSSVTHNSGTTIGQIVVNNPKPEPTSDSLPRTLRKISYLANARGR